MKILFLLASSGLSGGNYVIYQHALYAKERGHEVTIATFKREDHYANVWHPAIPQLRFAHIDQVSGEMFDIAFATFWFTAAELHRIPARQYAYFVQSIESRFFPESDTGMRGMIDAVYGWNMPGFTEATWIQQHLAARHGSQYRLVRNGIRKDLYVEQGDRIEPRPRDGLRILIEGPFGVIKNTARALSTTRRAGAKDVWLLTTTDIPWYPGVKRIFRNLPIEQVPAIYRSCDVIVKLSLVEGMFGPPLEMFHCGGTAVVYDVTGHDEYIVDGRNAVVARIHDEDAVIAAIRRLGEDREWLGTLKQGALETASTWPSWEESSRLFVETLDVIASAERFTRDHLIACTEKLYRDFPAQLSNLAGAAEPGRPRSRWMAPIRGARDAARRYRTLFGHIAESYR